MSQSKHPKERPVRKYENGLYKKILVLKGGKGEIYDLKNKDHKNKETEYIKIRDYDLLNVKFWVKKVTAAKIGIGYEGDDDSIEQITQGELERRKLYPKQYSTTLPKITKTTKKSPHSNKEHTPSPLNTQPSVSTEEASSSTTTTTQTHPRSPIAHSRQLDNSSVKRKLPPSTHNAKNQKTEENIEEEETASILNSLGTSRGRG